MAAVPTHAPLEIIKYTVDASFNELGVLLKNLETKCDEMKVEIQKLKGDQDTRKMDIIKKFTQLPTFSPDGKFKAYESIAGKGGKKVEPGTIFTKYYVLDKLYQEIYKKIADAKKIVSDVAPKFNNGDTREYIEYLQYRCDDLLEDIAVLKEYPEVQIMTDFKYLLEQIEYNCNQYKQAFYNYLSKPLSISYEVRYPEVSESFREREISYYIEPSGMQGAGKETKFLFYDFLKQRRVDEESD